MINIKAYNITWKKINQMGKWFWLIIVKAIIIYAEKGIIEFGIKYTTPFLYKKDKEDRSLACSKT